jgi:hypothetical protein
LKFHATLCLSKTLLSFSYPYSSLFIPAPPPSLFGLHLSLYLELIRDKWHGMLPGGKKKGNDPKSPQLETPFAKLAANPGSKVIGEKRKENDRKRREGI